MARPTLDFEGAEAYRTTARSLIPRRLDGELVFAIDRKVRSLMFFAPRGGVWERVFETGQIALVAVAPDRIHVRVNTAAWELEVPDARAWFVRTRTFGTAPRTEQAHPWLGKTLAELNVTLTQPFEHVFDGVSSAPMDPATVELVAIATGNANGAHAIKLGRARDGRWISLTEWELGDGPYGWSSAAGASFTSIWYALEYEDRERLAPQLRGTVRDELMVQLDRELVSADPTTRDRAARVMELLL